MPSDPTKTTKRQRLNARVEAALQGVICDRCGATLDSISDVCTADLTDECPGFSAIDNAKRLAHDAECEAAAVAFIGERKRKNKSA